VSLAKADIERLFRLLDEELGARSVRGEVYLVGGAVMCLVFDARESTRDLDAFFKPAREVREAAARVATRTGEDPRWLNDAVKGFLSEKGSYSQWLELPHLTVFCANPEYLLAMKCLAMRIGAEFQDVDDVRYLLRHLGIEAYDEAVDVITRYYPLERFPQKALYALEEILAKTP
jgi:hypothetical protein